MVLHTGTDGHTVFKGCFKAAAAAAAAIGKGHLGSSHRASSLTQKKLSIQETTTLHIDDDVKMAA